MKKICPGYTLIELLVVASLMVILFLVGFASYSQFNRSQILDQAAADLKNNLRLAQGQAMAGEKPSGCGTLEGYQVEFFADATNKDGYTIKPKCSGATTEKTFYLPSPVRFDPPPESVLFKVLAQGVENARTIKLKAFNMTSMTRTIEVTTTGEIK